MANDTSAFVPELWAAEAVQLLYEELIYGSIVHREFSKEIAKFGDTVHTRKIHTFIGKRKQNDLDELETQDVSADEIDVVLNQRVYISFLLGDAAMSLSFQDLIPIYLTEAVRGCARVLDQAIAGQVYQFRENAAGHLGGMTTANSNDYLLDMRKVFNDNNVPAENRWLGLTSRSETLMQKNSMFKQAYSIGDSGQALRNALLGRISNWNLFLEMNTPSVAGVTVASAAGTLNGAHSAGATILLTANTTGLTAGKFVYLVGDDQLLRIVSVNAGVSITVDPPLRSDVVTGAAFKIAGVNTVDQTVAIPAGDKTALVANGYPANWLKPIVLDTSGVGMAPKVGQAIAFGTTTAVYCAIQIAQLGANSWSVLLDRPLEDTIADGDTVHMGVSGDYNFALQREAIALVSRPLAVARTGVQSAVSNFKGMALRAEISRDSLTQAHRVTIDGLFGIAVLDVDRGGILYG